MSVHTEGGRNRRERDTQEGEERDILIKGTIKGLVRNIALGKFSGILKDDPN